MRRRRSFQAAVVVALAMSAALVGCSLPEFGGFAESSSQDAAADGNGSAASGGSGGAGASGGSGATGGAGGCATDGDCAAAAAPRCNAATGACVACLSSVEDCPAGQFCAPGFVCRLGCKSSAECNADAGRDVFRCDPETGKCLGCTVDADCAPGNVCGAETQCVPGCTDQQPCPENEDCCSGACKAVLFDSEHCGTCDRACATTVGNGREECSVGQCKVVCDAFKADCNGNAADGCEVDVKTDSSHCGLCRRACTGNQQCVDGTCQ